MGETAAANRYLGIYLRDHMAGAIAGLELAKRSLASNRDDELGTFLAGLVREIEEDRRTLEDVMGRLGVSTSAVKNAAGWAAEKVGRLKLNGRLSGYSPLSRLEELEALNAGVQAKATLWRTLRRISPPELGDVDLDGLLARAERQSEAILEQHDRAAEAIRGG